MIPRNDFDVDPDLPPEATFWTPDAATLRGGALGFFRDAWQISPLGGADLAALLAEEHSLAELCSSLTDSVEDFDAVAGAIESCDWEALPDRVKPLAPPRLTPESIGDIPPLAGLEIGVAGLAHSLASIGCYPAASCRGHVGSRAWADRPVVFFAADRRLAEALVRPVGSTGCGFSFDLDRSNLLVVEAPSIAEMMALAEQIAAIAS